MESPLDAVRFRHACEADRNFIINSFVKSFRKSHEVRHLDDKVYFENQQKVAEDTLDMVQCLVAHHIEDADHVFGYVLFENNEPRGAVIHFLYVKQPYRRFGIARSLWMEAVKDTESVQHTHTTFTSLRIADKFKSKFNPYLKIGVRL